MSTFTRNWTLSTVTYTDAMWSLKQSAHRSIHAGETIQGSSNYYSRLSKKLFATNIPFPVQPLAACTVNFDVLFCTGWSQVWRSLLIKEPFRMFSLRRPRGRTMDIIDHEGASKIIHTLPRTKQLHPRLGSHIVLCFRSSARLIFSNITTFIVAQPSWRFAIRDSQWVFCGALLVSHRPTMRYSCREVGYTSGRLPENVGWLT